MADEERLIVALEARITQFEKNFQRATRTSSQSFDRIERRSKQATDRIESNMGAAAGKIASLGKSMAAGFIGGFVAGGIAGIISQVGSVAQGIAEVGDAARRSGLDLAAFQELKYVAEQNRIGVDSLVDGIKELNIRGAEFIRTNGGPGAAAFAALGYNAETLATKLKDPSALFSELIGKLGQLDRASAISLADEIFGGNGGEKFVQLLEGGEEAIERTRQEARDLGLVMDEELVANAAELDRKFNAVANTVGVALKTAIVEAATALTNFIAQFNGWIEATEARAGFGGNQQWTDMLGPDARNQLRTDLNGAYRNVPVTDFYAGFDVGADGQFVVERPPAPVIPVTPPAASSGGGGASSMREQRDAAAELITELEEELRLLGQSEIEQRVNAELRKAGAGATDAQKASIRDLVTAIDTEADAMDRLESAMDTAEGLTKDFLGGLLGDLRNGVDGATALANAFGNLGEKLLDLALNTAIESLFTSMLDGVAGGGLGAIFGLAGGGEVQTLAGGGRVRGAGTGTSDSIPTLLSNGEHVIRAAQAQKFRPLLDAINDGRIGRFADGGAVGHAIAPLTAANDNRFAANQNITVNAPVTVNASGGTASDNQDLAERMSRELNSTLRGVVVDELRAQQKNGNLLNTRSR